MLNRPSVVRLRESLTEFAQNVAQGEPAPEIDMRERVCSVVEDLRALNWPPERVIVAVKQIADDAGLKPSRKVLMISGELTAEDAMLQKLVRWCIEQYYEEVPPS